MIMHRIRITTFHEGTVPGEGTHHLRAQATDGCTLLY